MDWKKKLTSRKLWMAVASFVSMLIIAFGMAEETAAQVSAIIMAGASVLGFIIGNGWPMPPIPGKPWWRLSRSLKKMSNTAFQKRKGR